MASIWGTTLCDDSGGWFEDEAAALISGPGRQATSTARMTIARNRNITT
jgi:hypothetical protein